MSVNKYWLRESLKRQQLIFENSLILNPTENVPLIQNIQNEFQHLNGLYVTDQNRGAISPEKLKVAFGGRERASYDNRKINSSWAQAFEGASASLRLLSGLHAHIALFMSLANIGDTVLLLPEEGGGHFSVSKILKRLGLSVIYIPLDTDTYSIDLKNTKKIIEENKIDFLFIDRSEGVVYEDFTELVNFCKNDKIYSIFDASQYVTNIICKDFKNPFDMGFDLIVATLHKNFPGPQKALVVTQKIDQFWEIIVSDFSIFISNSHPLAIYQAGEAILHNSKLKKYSHEMLATQRKLNTEMLNLNINMVLPKKTSQNTHHLWIKYSSPSLAHRDFKVLEKLRINTNFRLLPYGLGHGIRMGTSAAVLQGLTVSKVPKLASLLHMAFNEGFSLCLKHKFKTYINHLRENNEFT